ncbi:MAG TPA: glycosyltransferase family 4 protein [Polyangiaceae bacterium]|nr:glycosyltransferase family 4 protein [Polyangiaceae bacterium]
MAIEQPSGATPTTPTTGGEGEGREARAAGAATAAGPGAEAGRRERGDLAQAPLRYAGLFEEPSGYGQAARAHLGALVGAGVRVRPHLMISSSERVRGGSGAEFCRGLPKPFADGNERLAILHTIPTSFQDLTKNERVRVGLTAWDAPVLPSTWVEPSARVDEIWVPSEFSAGAFREATKTPVEVIPHPVVPFEGGAAPYPGLPDGRFFFLSVFEWQERKNPIGLLRAFRAAFQGKRDVALVLKLGYHFGASRDDIARELRREARGGVGPWRAPDVYVIWDDLSPPMLARLFRRADAYVSLHRAEGFGLCMAQAMATGKPVVATAYSANLEYMDDASAFLVPGELVRARSEPWHPFEREMRWCEADRGAAVEALRACAYDDAERERRASAGRARVLALCGPGPIGRRMAERVARLGA